LFVAQHFRVRLPRKCKELEEGSAVAFWNSRR
jgi:hypothetical protein